MDLNIDPTYISHRCGVEDPRAVVKDLEAALIAAKSRRDEILRDLGKTQVAIDKGDYRARFVQQSLNKQEAAAGRLVLAIAKQIEMAGRHVKLAQGQADAIAEAKAQAAGNGAARRLIQLEVRAPDGRVLRQWHKSVDDARKSLQPGYEVTGQVISGNIVSPIGSSAPTIMDSLLDAFGDRLLVWLAERGVGKPVVTLPSNGRDMQ